MALFYKKGLGMALERSLLIPYSSLCKFTLSHGFKDTEVTQPHPFLPQSRRDAVL